MASSARTDEELKAMFVKMDTNTDGTITVEELKKGLKENIPDEDFEFRFGNSDEDGNRTLNFEEFKDFMTPLSEEQDKLLRAEFDNLDADGSGFITKEEARALFFGKNGDKKAEKFWNTVLRDMDTNDDDKISFEEYKKGLAVLM